MRRIAPLLLALTLSLAAPVLAPAAQAQRVAAATVPDTLVLARVESAFRAGDAASLLAEAAEPVDLAIFGQGASYTRSQAALVLQDFFRRHPPAQVAFEEEVVSENRRSVIGHYREAGGAAPSAVFVRLRARGDRWEIRSIRIERAGRR
jgi:hypothetical protein